MKIRILNLLLVFLMGSCMLPFGLVYTNIKIPSIYPTQSESDLKFEKRGEACSQAVLGVAAWGDSSIETAAKIAGVKRISTVDLSVDMILMGGIYTQWCTIVSGE